jgi:hypothetical protein
LRDGGVGDDFARIFFLDQEPDSLRNAQAFCQVISEMAIDYADVVIELENAKHKWRDIWTLLKCEGDFDASLAEWSVYYNQR